jgi:hypothetical protein
LLRPRRRHRPPCRRQAWRQGSQPPAFAEAEGALLRLLATFRGWYSPIPEIIAVTNSTAILQNDIADRRLVAGSENIDGGFTQRRVRSRSNHGRVVKFCGRCSNDATSAS